MRLTNWSVITGAPCSGKTAVIDELARRGFRTVPEVARAFIDAEMRKGRRLEDIKSDAAWFEGQIFRTKLAVEAQLPTHARLFFRPRPAG